MMEFHYSTQTMWNLQDDILNNIFKALFYMKSDLEFCPINKVCNLSNPLSSKYIL